VENLAYKENLLRDTRDLVHKKESHKLNKLRKVLQILLTHICLFRLKKRFQQNDFYNF
jgi:hypothetical protein